MKLLHTSDWHLGQSFMGQSRLKEHQKFLSFLLESIENYGVDTLIVAGDIFDTMTPPNYALELYYNFLTQLLQTECKNVIIIAGNHDSVATLKAPKQLLQALNIHLIATGDEDEDEIVPIYDGSELVALVCAVPFLRDYVVRKSSAAQTGTQKEKDLTAGIKEHYETLHKRAVSCSSNIPIIATGHLTTVGAVGTLSEREIYIGTTLNIESGFLAKMFTYVALGHLHTNQKVGVNHVRYSGSPIPLSFSEANQIKKFNIVKIDGKSVNITEVEIPQYRRMLRMFGDATSLLKQLEDIEDKNSWIEIELNDINPFYANKIIREKANQLELQILVLKIAHKQYQVDQKEHIISLDELTPMELFQRRLDDDGLEDEAFKQELQNSFKKIVEELIL